jgi:hypothetical protein
LTCAATNLFAANTPVRCWQFLAYLEAGCEHICLEVGGWRVVGHQRLQHCRHLQQQPDTSQVSPALLLLQTTKLNVLLLLPPTASLDSHYAARTAMQDAMKRATGRN